VKNWEKTMEIVYFILTLLAALLLPFVIMVAFRLAMHLSIRAYQKLWQWLNQSLGRRPRLLLDKDSSDNYAIQLVFLVGMLIGALLSDTIEPESLTDFLYSLAQMLPGMMLGGFLGLCLAEVCAYIHELDITVRLRKYLASFPIVQRISHYLNSLAVLAAPVVQRINRWLDSLNTLIDRIVERIPARLALITLFVGAIFGCVFLYANVYAIDTADYQQGQERAGDLVMALETYKHATGKYPVTLADMVPQYVLQILRPAWRYEFEYLTCRQGAGYLLYYRLQATAGKYCGYGDRLQTWQCVAISSARFQNSSCDIPE
jgi:hypothetical protein